MKTRKPVRFTTADAGRFAKLALVEAVAPAKLSPRNWEELERLSRKRHAVWLQTITPAEKRRLRRMHKHDKRLFKEFTSLFSKILPPSV